MPTTAELRKRLEPLAAEIFRQRDKLNAEGYTPTAEDESAWTKANTDYNAAKAALDRSIQADAIETTQRVETAAAVGRRDYDGREVQRTSMEAAGYSDQPVTDETRSLALNAWCREQLGYDLDDRHEAACRAVRLNPRAKTLTLASYSTQDLGRLQRQFRGARDQRALDGLMDFRASLSSQIGASGAYLIPPATLMNSLEVNMLAFGGMRQAAQTISTSSGEPLNWPTADDTSNTGAQLGENTSIGSSVDPSFGAVVWNAYKFSSKPVLVPYELLEDSAFDLPSLLGAMLGERLGRITNTKFTTGTGAATPKGIVTAASAGVTAASGTAIAADELFGLQHSIDPAYRPGSGWMMHDNILLAIRKLKDGTGQYLWQSGLSMGAPDMLLGSPITINQDMQSSVATGTVTVLYGRLDYYKIRRVNGIRLYRLEERYRDTDQDGFIAFVREDGNLLTAGTAPVKKLTQA